MTQQQMQGLYRYCIMLTSDPASAEDLLQSSLEKWLKRGQPQAFNYAYLRTVVRNQFIDLCRRQQRIAFEPIEDGMPSMMDESCLADLYIQHDLIEYVIARLTVADREVLYLWAVDGYTAAEIAIELNQPRGTILSRLHRIKQKVTEMQPEKMVVGGDSR
ncbi:RNA polymerase sigma factor [Shewanella gelidii]|uniref:Sigma-70 family RNA polymerase sigma factor n=1 Tax=Shewanella gelidii TaxID=1642821 RepID=A0A917JYZ9_9GAMM|nr:RNA polymerase sigma factor [Shewanella gelidii]MCL1098881.1 RNA polymerase sigma factor [Shewanella gelidii]GGI89678.1 hypothetical protein GCM10009332_28780 [Shewanella gelidii]